MKAVYGVFVLLLLTGLVCQADGQMVTEAAAERVASNWVDSVVGSRGAWGGEQRSLFDVAARCAASLARVFEGGRKTMALPDEWR